MFVRFSSSALIFLWFLIILIVLNLIYFHFIISNEVNINHIEKIFETSSVINDIEKEIEINLQYLTPNFKTKNSKYLPIQRQLIKSFNVSKDRTELLQTWHKMSLWKSNSSLFPDDENWLSKIIMEMKSSKIISAQNSNKGTQMKFMLNLEHNLKIFFKPKRYNLSEIIHGNIYAGFDRHNAEVVAYYLALVLNFKWIAPATIRKVHVKREILSVASSELMQTTLRKGKSTCLYGSCFYCKINETVCEDIDGYIEGAAILYIDKPLRVSKSPWRRSYSFKKMEWQTEKNYCKKISQILPRERLLDLIDTAIFDFFMQNGDRHRYEVTNNQIVLLDNGKGLGNPFNDEIDILAPLYQCCRLRMATWNQLVLLSGGVLSETVKQVASFHDGNLTTEFQYKALDRRLLKIYAIVEMCIGKNGGAKVFV